MKVKVIAEAGTNHNGKLEWACQLVDAAANAGADFVKFQIINPDSLYVPFYWDGDKKVENLVHKRRMTEVLTYEEWEKVNDYAKNRGILFTASVFDTEGVDFLIKLQVPFIKLASSDLNNTELISYVAQKHIPLIISTGMASLEEVSRSANIYLELNNPSFLTILHCVSVYPCELEKSRLFRIPELRNLVGCSVGFSDHTLTSKAVCAAIPLGIEYVEKHFTLDKSLEGFDHKYASNPYEFIEYVSDIRAVETALKTSSETNYGGENVTKVRARRGLYLLKPVKQGEPVALENIVSLRPTNKLNPEDITLLAKCTAGQDIREFQSMYIIGDQVFVDEDDNWKNANAYWVNEMKEKSMLKG